jgi:hypothetical protein
LQQQLLPLQQKFLSPPVIVMAPLLIKYKASEKFVMTWFLNILKTKHQQNIDLDGIYR